jgi:hypothetical protein
MPDVIRKGWKSKRKLTRDEFAKKCGVSKMAISKAVRSGKVVEDDEGRVDITNPVNRAYLQSDHAVMKRARVAGKKSTGRADGSKRKAKLYEAKTIEQTRQYRENANWAVQRRAKDLGLLVERAKVEQMMAAFGQELKLRLLDLPRRISANLFGLARAEAATPMAIEGALNKELSEALAACKERARAIGLGSLGS